MCLAHASDLDFSLFFEHIPAIGNSHAEQLFHQSLGLMTRLSAHAHMLVQAVNIDSLCTHSK